MPASFDNSGKPAYMYDEVGDTWYAFGAKIDTASAYEWTNTQTYLNDVTFDDAVIFRDGFNNFLNPAARDAAITSPVQGTIIFVRQDAGGNTINQIQYYSGSAWTANDGDISQITAGTGLTGGGTAGNITVSVDTAVTATTNNTLTLSNKTIALGSNTVSGTTAQFNTALTDGDFATLAGSETLTNKTLALGSNTVSGTVSQFNTALTDGDFATLAGTETLTNKTLTTPVITIGQNTPSFTTNAYTLVLADQYEVLLASNGATAGTINIPTNASIAFAIGTQITVIQTGTGQLTIAATTPGTTTVLSNGATVAQPKLRTQYSSATLIKTGTDTWYVVGDIN
jgi:hypothetical protein